MASGATIDHIIAVTILLTAMLLTMMTFNGLFAQALEYDTNRQIANKAVDVMNSICLSPGSPVDWGETDDDVLGFGLQDPDASGYTLSPYSVMRLQTHENDLIEYPKGPGAYYNNLTAGFGSGVYTSVGECLTHEEVSDFLGLTGEYDFSIDITPTLNVNIEKLSESYVSLKVNVTGLSLPLSGATLKYYIFHIAGDGEIIPPPDLGVVQTNPYGEAILDFTSILSDDAFSFVVYAELGGVTGVGYYAQDALVGNLPFVVPLIEDYETGEVIIAHAWDIFKDDSITDIVHCDASFFVLTSDFHFQEVEVVCPTGPLNYGESQPYFTLDIPEDEVGILVISYVKDTNKVGSVIVPWGVGTVGVPAMFKSEFGSKDYNFVATEIRQVTIDDISYQVKVSVWKLGN
ncbi:MAG: hypothetical protein NWF02_00080 [Candidatus Bathyarchaeota archaeon]|nr:hypothetical protein [Candidatus Bathyarchaeum sp.]